MVRRIRSCCGCQSRFISEANKPICSICETAVASSILDTPTTMTTTMTTTKTLLNSTPSSPTSKKRAKLATTPTITSCSSESVSNVTVDLTTTTTTTKVEEHLEEEYENESSSRCGSEGGDDVHCTQIVLSSSDEEEEDDDDDGNDQEVQVVVQHQPTSKEQEVVSPTSEQEMQQHLKSITTTTTTTATTPQNNMIQIDEDVCLICGTNLSKLKRRVDHIKRCSKKHNITGRDVKLNHDNEHFAPQQQQSNQQQSSTNKNSNNPYTKESDWHGEATIDLQLADQEENQQQQPPPSSFSEPAGISSAQKQSSLTTFFQVPARSLNNVLLAGARRASKVAEIVQKKASGNNNNINNNQKAGGKRRSGGGRWGSFQRRNYSKSECPMYKKISGTDFVCDGFHYARSDHYGGITSSWNEGTIYCSLPTAALVSQQLGVDKKHIHPLPMGSPTVLASRGKPVTVTLIDANHCPGAVMFLFETSTRTILHVGDFRWNRDFMSRQIPLKPFFKQQQQQQQSPPRQLDELFLDTTYCDPKYTLPSQDETIRAIIAKFQSEQERYSSSTTLHLFGAYTIGKEKMYLSVAEHFNMKVYVDSSRYRVLSALNWPKERMRLLTKHKEEASIWVVPLGDVNMKKMPKYLPMANTKPFGKVYDRIVGYRPTGWSLGGKPSSSLVSSRTSGNLAVHSVPYSEHSSFPELVDCLECLKPKKIIPTVSVSKSADQISMLLTALKQKQTRLLFS